jgi:hypothetical protein
MMERKISELFMHFDEIKEWRKDVSFKAIMKKEKKIWSLKDFAEKDDNRETVLTLIRLAKVVAEGNERKHIKFIREAQLMFNIDAKKFEEKWRKSNKKKLVIEPYRVKLSKIGKNMKPKLIESWKNLSKKIDKRKEELKCKAERKKVRRYEKLEEKKRLNVIEQKNLSDFDKWSNIKTLKSSFPVTFLGQFAIRRQRYNIEEINLWRLREHEFWVRDYFRKYDVPMGMTPKIFMTWLS